MVDSVTLPLDHGQPTPAQRAAADDASIAKFIAQQTPGQTTVAPASAAATEESALIAGKFKSQDDLIKAYKELESKLGAPKNVTEPVTATEPAAASKADPLAVPEKAAEEAVASAKLDMAALTAEYTSNGKLSDANLAKLEAVGISADMVAAYADGLRAKAESTAAADLTASGVSVQDYAGMVQWAAKNMSASDVKEYNEAVASHSSFMRQAAIASLRSRFVQANGTQPQLVRGDRATSAVDVYRSNEQMLSDMRDPRYSKDPAFRADVYAKIERTKQANG